jgi:hypothetical protein
MDSRTLETLSILRWKYLNGESKKQLTKDWHSYIISNKKDEDEELIEAVSRIYRCGKRIAHEYASVLKTLKISGTKIKQFVGK